MKRYRSLILPSSGEVTFVCILTVFFLVVLGLGYVSWHDPAMLGLVQGSAQQQRWMNITLTLSAVLFFLLLMSVFALRRAGKGTFNKNAGDKGDDDVVKAQDAAVATVLPLISQIRSHLHFRYHTFWRNKVTLLLVVGDEATVSQLVPGLVAAQWQEGNRTVLIYGGDPAEAVDSERFTALRQLRYGHPLDGIIRVLGAEQTMTPALSDSDLRWLEQVGGLLRHQPPVWLWQLCKSKWSQAGRVPQPVGISLSRQASADEVAAQLTGLLPQLREQGMAQIAVNPQHDFLLRLAQSLTDGEIAHWQQRLVPWYYASQQKVPLGGVMFSLPESAAAEAQPVTALHVLPPSTLWPGITAACQQVRGSRPVTARESWLPRAVLLATGCCAAGMVLSFVLNRQQIILVADQARALVAHPAVSDAQLTALHDLRNQAGRLQHDVRSGAPWYQRSGLNHAQPLLDALMPWYIEANNRLLRDPATQALHQKLRHFADLPPASPLRSQQAKPVYDQLKALLMMSRPDKAEAAFYAATMKTVQSARPGISPGLWQSLAPDLWAFYAAELAGHPEMAIKPDAALVSQVRQSLLQQLGRRNAEGTLYENILTQVRHNYTDLTLEDMTAGTEAGRLFTTKESVPGMFTRRAWENEVKDAIDQAASARREEIDWVLSDSRKPVTGDVSPEALKARLTQRYFTDFAGSWLGFLNSLRWVPARNIADVTDQLTLMSDVRQSPLIALMNTLSTQGQTGQQGIGLSDSLMNSAKKLIKRDDIPAIDQQAGPTGPLQETFGPLLALTGKKDTDGAVSTGGTLTLAEYLTQVTRVRLHLQQVATSPDPQAMMQTLAQTVFQGKSVDLTDTQQYGTLMAAGLGEEWHSFGQTVFVRPLTQAWENVLRPSAAGLNDQWRRSVVTGWDAAFDGRYPFVAAGSDASLPELAEYIRQGSGRIDTFLTSQLAGVLHKEGNRWVQDKSASQGLTVNLAFLKAINELSGLSAVLFADGGQGLSFDLQARPVPRVVDTTLTVDGQVLHYFNQLPEWQAFHWPGETYSPGTMLTWSTTTTGSRLYGDYSGIWGLIRWLDQSQRQQLDPHRWMLSMKAPDGNTLQWVLRPQLGSGPLALLSLRGFTLPEQIFLAGSTTPPQVQADDDDDETDGMVP
ncbi:ImcF-related family protein [Enterobacter cloacae complex sp. ESBL7]|uniref:ImcF-related family protein n=1 Tax=Enterobacter cloacae complex sp. ESBL7 TaxID=3163325 RepID=UPI003564123C